MTGSASPASGQRIHPSGSPAPAVAAIRLAVRHAVADLPPGALVLVACSGGPDSLALAAATAFVAPRRALRAGLLTVDHGWDGASDQRAESVVAQGRALRLDPVELLVAHSARSEGAARDARRAALAAAAERLGAAALLLGHTLDDQAETVLLRLARGAGARSLGAMSPRDGLLRRPLLGLRKEQTRAACRAEGLDVWEDPTNADAAFARARVRHALLPALEEQLGPGIAESLSRSADLLRADAEALDALTDDAYAQATAGSPAGAGSVELAVEALGSLPSALRTRVLRRAALALGASASALRAEHVWAMEELVTRWRGQQPVPLPSGVTARRRGDRISVAGPGETRSGRRGTADGGDAASGPTGPRPSPRRPDAARPDAEEGMPVSQAEVSAPDSADQSTTGSPDQSKPGSAPADTPPWHDGDIGEVLVSEEEIATRIAALAAQVDADYAGRELLLVGVLKGAVMVMADLSRALRTPVTMEFMAVSSYGSASSSSGVVRILKDLDRSIEGRDVLVVEDIIDSGLTLSWLLKNLRSRNPGSLEVLALFRKPEAITVDVDVRYVGFDIPSAFVVGYGLDYAEHYRTLPFVGTLTPEAIARGPRPS
ncbi:hypoxanthine phosphoribosyltransferase [Pseudofrankia inefficax]|uniref:tRNA(Ile)-lysidine synthase n=1 Tax=Pseudofrankia inefficax (strain DSM 45817 / CECT 9037 / DDB 130130 / EuI1c) TaxID=298654 RepID=E3J7C0_PSEI1|nr:hypoxanthine phosphoribosyltransferase [Pseudofrankia inefficax]ADP78393.1 hypoxanthine phosphoribosyltransferase [Pseudofrankia inefficax]